jgi:diguanylate cyclase (GGDEF)-like protein
MGTQDQGPEKGTLLSLKTRILLLAAAPMLLSSVASLLAYRELSQSIIERWGTQVAEIQVRYDSARLLQSLEREVGLARQMSESTTLINWAQHPDDRILRAGAIREMESFRSNFRDNSYFVALRKNGHYYYNNGANQFAGNQFRYVLDPQDPDDAWFFQLISEGRDFHLNVNPDSELGVTKLWINVLMRDPQGEIVGIVGTGLNLDGFLQHIVDSNQPGITTLFVDDKGAIQLHRDRSYIDFASITKPEDQKNTLGLLLEKPADRREMMNLLESLRQGPGTAGEVASSFVTVNGRRHLAGAAFLPTIGWFEVTLLDLSTLLPNRYLWPLIAVFLLALVVTLLVFQLAIRRCIIQPLTGLESAVKAVTEGNFVYPALRKPDNEIGRLARHFETMAKRLEESTHNLETQVSYRTEELHRLARVDALTGLRNRRGLDEILAAEMERSRRQQTGFGLIWLDIDLFKSINDQQGHQAGDDTLCRVALWLKASVRPYDHPGRWGGDEFVVVLSPCNAETMAQIAHRVRASIEQDSRLTDTPVTVSVGAYFSHPGDTLDDILHRADQALYLAKDKGRNRVCVADHYNKESSPA